MKKTGRTKRRIRRLMGGDQFACTIMISKITKSGKACQTSEKGQILRGGWYTSPRIKD